MAKTTFEEIPECPKVTWEFWTQQTNLCLVCQLENNARYGKHQRIFRYSTMKRFENAQVGDNVYSRLHGFGEIMYIDKFILKCWCNIKNHEIDSEYLLDDKIFKNDKESILFYSDGINNYLTEMPETTIPIVKPIDENPYCKSEIIQDAKTEINWQEWEGHEEVDKNDKNYSSPRIMGTDRNLQLA